MLTGTEHFSRAEVERVSSSPIPDGVADELQATLEWMEGIRAVVGAPFVLTSAYRSATHNVDVHGSPTSDHPHGKALDGYFIGADGAPLPQHDVADLLFEAIDTDALGPFDQIIFYPTTTGHYHFGRGPGMRAQTLVKTGWGMHDYALADGPDSIPANPVMLPRPLGTASVATAAGLGVVVALAGAALFLWGS